MRKKETEIRLLLVDDHNVVRSGLRSLLCSVEDFEVLGEAGDGQMAIDLCEQLKPDVVLMDLRMPLMSGAQATAAIKKRFPLIHVIALTMHDGDEDVCQAIRSGAEAFILKSATDKELIQTVRAVLRGEYRFPRWLNDQLMRRNPKMALTEIEIKLISLMAEGLSNKELADCLGVSEHKIKNDLKSVFSKLGCANRTEAATTALERGFLGAKH